MVRVMQYMRRFKDHSTAAHPYIPLAEPEGCNGATQPVAWFCFALQDGPVRMELLSENG